MAQQKKQLIAQRTMNELQLLAQELRSELFKLKMDHAKNQLKQTSLFRTKRDDLARVLTAEKAKREIKTEVVIEDGKKGKSVKIFKQTLGKHVQGKQVKSKKEGQK